MKIARRKPLEANVGILGVGHYNYWRQFDGLLAKMHEKLAIFHDKVEKNGVKVENFGIIDDASGAYRVVSEIKSADIDLLFIDMLTYATSSTFGIVAREIDAPVVMAILQPMEAMDYARASTFMQLCNDDFCAASEFAGVSVRMGKKVPEIVIGMLENDPDSDREISDWCRVAEVRHDLKRARIGQMGHVMEAMLDMHADPTAITAGFGCHVVQTEPDDVMTHFRKLNPSDNDVKDKRREILGFFAVPEPVSDPITCKLRDFDLEMAAMAAVALEKFIDGKKLDGLAYYYEGEENSAMRNLVSAFIVGNSLLTAAGFPMCGEFDIKTCIAMMMMDRLDIGGSFAEFHPIDFKRGTILVGHDGPHHLNIADGRPVIRSLKKYHGKPGCGASVEFKIKEGPITMLGIGVKADGKFKMIIAEGESVKGPVPPTGNTNTHGRFRPDVKTFLRRWLAEGPTHHFALGIGHEAQTIKKTAWALNIEAKNVTENA